MPTITVSASGGTRNWSDTATWVGGVLPAVGDDIVANATSGALIVDSNRTCLTINFTNYVNTFTINNGVTLTVTGTAITLGSGMAYTQGTTGVLSTLGNQTAISIAFNGITIPRLTIGKTSVLSTQTVTVSGATPTVQNLVVNNGASNSNTNLAGTIINVSSSLNINGLGPLIGNIINFSGTCTIASTNTTSTTINGFTVLSGSSLQMLSNIGSLGPVIFSGTATLTPNLFSFFMGGLTNSINSSGVTWYNFSYNVNGGVLTLLSDLNISNNLGYLNTTIAGAFNINLGGGVNATGAINLGTGTVLNLIGTGVFHGTNGGTVNINTSNPAGYTIGSVAVPTSNFFNTTLNLVGTSVAQVYSTTGHSLFAATAVINTNNTPTGANISGGSEIIWGGLRFSNGSAIFTHPTTFLGNVVVNPTNGFINGGKIFVAGNISVSTGAGLQGVGIVEMNGSSNSTISAGNISCNLIINKSGGATVTNLTNITLGLGATGRSLSMNTTTLFGTTTVTLGGNTYTINNPSGSSFNNLTTPGNQVLILNNSITINNNLTLNGAITFQGTGSWTCANLLCSIANSTITLQNSVTYTTTTNVNMVGTAAQPITMISNTPTTTRAIWTLNQGATQSMVYVNGRAIDSNAGQTIWSFGGIITTSLVPLNWNVGARPSPYGFIGI
jgi:hypothetical protein